jgi:hypothetical protein
VPDWEDLVRDRLDGLVFGADRHSEIVRELAGYLADHAEGLRAVGLDPAAADAVAASEDWVELRRGVRAALRGEDDTTARIRRYFMPALLMHVLAVLALVAVQEGGIEPRVILVDPIVSGCIMFYIPWLLFLPFVGALRGLWGRMRSEDARTVLIGASFPAGIVGALLAAGTVGGVVENVMNGGLGLWYARFSGAMLLTWLVIPGLCMIAGALPFVVAAPKKSTTA